MPLSILIEDANFTKNIGTIRQSPMDIFDHFDGGIWLPEPPYLFQDLAMTIPAAADGDLVRVMLDASGNGYHFVAPSDERRPRFKIDSNGNPYLEYDSSGRGMNLSGDALGMFSGVSHAMVCVACNMSGLTDNRYVFRANNSTVNYRLFLGTTGDFSVRTFAACRNNGEPSALAQIPNVAGAHVFTGIADFAAGTASLYRNHDAATGSASGMTTGITAGAAASTITAGYNAAGSYAFHAFYGMIAAGGNESPEPWRLAFEQMMAARCAVIL